MKVSITLGPNVFSYEEADGHLLMDLFRLWLNAQQPGQDALKIEALTNRLKTNTDALSTVIAQFDKGDE